MSKRKTESESEFESEYKALQAKRARLILPVSKHKHDWSKLPVDLWEKVAQKGFGSCREHAVLAQTSVFLKKLARRHRSWPLDWTHVKTEPDSSPSNTGAVFQLYKQDLEDTLTWNKETLPLFQKQFQNFPVVSFSLETMKWKTANEFLERALSVLNFANLRELNVRGPGPILPAKMVDTIARGACPLLKTLKLDLADYREVEEEDEKRTLYLRTLRQIGRAHV
jgi:hypothetical protein